MEPHGGSWWTVPMTREEFSAAVERELPRMTATKGAEIVDAMAKAYVAGYRGRREWQGGVTTAWAAQ